MRSAFLTLVLALTGCATTTPLYPSRPTASQGAPSADPQPAKVVVHLTATAEGLKQVLDSKVPTSGETSFELKGQRAVEWERGPFTLRFADGKIEVKTDLQLRVELPVIGKQNVPLSVSVVGEPIITSDWKARLQGAKSKVESKDLRLRTLQGLASALETAQQMTDAYIEGFAWDLEPQVRDAWMKLSTPIMLPGDANGCAQLDVTSIEAGPTVVAGGLEKDVAFVVQPSVTLPCAMKEKPPTLPRLANVSTLPSGPFSVTVPIAARYDELAKAMSLAFTDGKLFFTKSFPELYLANPEVFASKSDELVVKLHLAGPIQAAGIKANLDGDLYFAGHPVVVDNELRIPDLEPTVETSSFLLGLKANLDRDGIREQARQALKLDLGERFSAVKQKLSSDVTFENGCLRANVAKLEVGNIYPHANYLRVYTGVTAQASVYLPCPAAAVSLVP